MRTASFASGSSHDRSHANPGRHRSWRRARGQPVVAARVRRAAQTRRAEARGNHARVTGFRNHELRTYLQNRFGLSPDKYTAAQLRYDLVKLRAKGWISKLKRSTRYVLTPKGMTEGTAVLKLKECLNGTVAEAPAEPPEVGSPQTPLQKEFRKVRGALQQLLKAQGLAAA
jgi:hypothetical protein